MSGQTSGIYNASKVGVSNGLPPSMPQIYSLSVNLIGAAQTLDFKSLANLHRLQNVQGIFIDNSAGAVTCTVSTVGGPTLQIPASYQGLFPLYLGADNTVTLNGYGQINLSLLNFPTPAAIWPTAAQIVTLNGTSAVQDVAAEGYLSNLQPTLTAISSGSVTSPATPASTQLFAANPARKYMLIQSAYNVAGAVFHDLWINPIGGTASVGGLDCVKIAAGTYYESRAYVSGAQINYYDAAGGNNITALQQ